MDINILKPIFKGQRCVILGFGREGHVWHEILRRLGVCAEIAVADMCAQEIEPRDNTVTLLCGDYYMDYCKGYDIILQSPGVPVLDKFNAETKAKILSQTELLLRLKPCRIIGVTGTKGKSTCASLIHHFLLANGMKTMLIGNIGVPPLKWIDEMNDDTIAVCEMSCHQLEFVRHSPDISVLLNLFPEHLDHYVSYEDYANAKRNICRYQKAGDTAIVGAGVDVTTEADLFIASSGGEGDIRAQNGSIFLFGEEIPRRRIKTNLCGEHNLYNVAIALAAAVKAGADLDKCLEALPEFKGLGHRLERVGTVNGVEYINDSICTVPEAAIAAVKAFDAVDCLILGGMDRGVPYDELGAFLNTGAVANVIVLPHCGERIARLITNPAVNVVHADDLDRAVAAAANLAKKRVLLSPAAASYGFYKNFEERGDHFRRLVQKLSQD